jgi:plasmid stability protein
MGTLTIRNLDDNVKRELRKRAAERGVSMEQEARDVLAEGVKSRARERPTVEDLMRLAIKPAKPFDMKEAQDELWDYLYEDGHQDDRR